jgi:polar amino acid transport system substrate-binding protein
MRLIALALLAAVATGLPATAQTIDRIRETGVFNIGFRTDAAPLSYATEDGLANGYSPILCANVAQFIANALNLEALDVKFVQVDASNRFEKVASGEVDLLCGAATITLSRRAIVDFSIPTYVDGTALVLPVDAAMNFTDLSGKTVGVRRDTTTAEALANSLESAGIAATIVPFDDHDTGFAALAGGEIDGYFADQSILLYRLSTLGEAADRFKLSDGLLTIEKQGLAMARGDADFRLLVDTALSQFYKDGTMRQIFDIALPGAEPGLALRALNMIAPDLP